MGSDFRQDFDARQSIRFIVRDQLRTKVLKNILPIPTHVEDIYQLLKFKEQYGAELKRFRRHIESFLLDLEAKPAEQVDERIKLFTEEAQEQIEEIASRMREHKWRLLSFNTLCLVASSVIPVIKAALTGDAVEALTGAPGLIGAIGSALSAEQLRAIRRQPLAYVALAQRSFRV